MPDNTFVNPYTFIPLSGRTRALDPTRDGKRLTGVVQCTLTTMTPLVIPECKIDADPKSSTPFFRVGGEPAIPASSLRGPIRSVYESLTNSCMRVNGGNLHSRGGRKRPGILCWEKGAYVLYEAARYRVHDKGLAAGWKTGEVAFIATDPERGDVRFVVTSGAITTIARNPFEGADQGYFLHANDMGRSPRDNKPSVFVRGERVDGSVDDKYISALKENVKAYVENCPGSAPAHEYQACLERLARYEEGAALPVWYSSEQIEGGTAFAFAPSQLSRSVYAVSPLGLAPKDMQPCISRKSLCPACELFGFVSQPGGGDAKASKVRFTDALPLGEVKTDVVTLPALMGPRSSAFEFYLQNDGRRKSFSPYTKGTHLAGRKAYWHSQTGLVEPEQTFPEGSEVNNATVECVRENSKFSFSVYVDGVTQLELNELVYVLTLGEYWDGRSSVGTHCHKIGHGKPVGAGSVHITVESVQLRGFDGSTYGLIGGDSWKFELGREGISGVLQRLRHTEAVAKVTSFTAIGKEAHISYPRTQQGGDIFAWFSRNRDFTRDLPSYHVVLPLATDGVQEISRDPRAVTIVANKPHNQGRRRENAPKTQTAERESGTVKSVKVGPDGRWYGFIARASVAGDIYFNGAENPALKAKALRPGAKVTFVAKQVTHKGKSQSHAIEVRVEG